MKVKPSHFSDAENHSVSDANSSKVCLTLFVFSLNHRVQRKNKFSHFHFCFGVSSQDSSVINLLYNQKHLCLTHMKFSAYYHQSWPLFSFSLVSNHWTASNSAFLCTRELVSVFALTLWGLFARGLQHTQKFLTHLPLHHRRPDFCSMFRRQTDRQTGTKGPRPNVGPLWGMATLVRHSNKKWSPGPSSQTWEETT